MEVDSESATTASTAKRDVRYDVEFTRAIKENHGHPIVDVAWCPFKGGEAYYATVGANQVWLDVNPFSLSLGIRSRTLSQQILCNECTMH